MKTNVTTSPPSHALENARIGARLAWRRRVARVGSLIQLGFAALWLGRGALSTGWAVRLPLAIALVGAAVALGVWGEARTRGLGPRPQDEQSRRVERAVTVATALQLAASVALPFVVSALDRPDLTVGTISVTIGALLLWLRAKLNTRGHLVAGVLLVVIPIALALALTGSALTASTGLATGAILLGSAFVGIRSLLKPAVPLRVNC